jgi:two-component system sensor histidine kinase FlrB
LFYFLAISAPLSITVAVLFDIDTLLVYALPLLVVTIYFALFVGVARLRYYDIEVRALRSGEIAASAAETTRLAALGEMAASFAHEVRNPLTGVRSLTQRLAEEDIDREKRMQYTRVILDEMNRIEGIVDNMLGVARRAPFPSASSTVDLDSLFHDIVLLTASRARRADVTVDVSAGGLTVDTSPEALAQALLNLTLNAIAHSPAGGCVRLTAERTAEAISVRVSDEGAGVPPDERARVFEPFYSSRPDGTGLGLSVVRTLARQAGWTVDIDDAETGGAVFRITIPRHAAQAPRKAVAQEAAR